MNTQILVTYLGPGFGFALRACPESLASTMFTYATPDKVEIDKKKTALQG